eukprot:448088-Rhodomonas_salina.2
MAACRRRQVTIGGTLLPLPSYDTAIPIRVMLRNCNVYRPMTLLYLSPYEPAIPNPIRDYYAMSGTTIAYGRASTEHCGSLSAVILRICYAIFGTETGYAATTSKVTCVDFSTDEQYLATGIT